MKKFLIIIIVSFLSLSGFSIDVNAQEANETLVVSPPFQILEYNEGEDVSGSITVDNSYSENVIVNLSPVVIQIQDESRNIIDSELKNNIVLNISSVEIRSGKSVEFDFEIINPENFTEGFYPGIAINRSDDTSSEPVNIDGQIISTIILESSKAFLAFDVNVDVEQVEVWGENVTVIGNVENNGERAFSPSGDLLLTKDQKRISQNVITGQINEILLPGQTKEFRSTFKLDYKSNNILDKFGNYDIKINVNPNPYPNSLEENVTVFYIPYQLLLLATSLVLILIISSLLILQNRRK